jgi:hypothetical protein
MIGTCFGLQACQWLLISNPFLPRDPFKVPLLTLGAEGDTGSKRITRLPPLVCNNISAMAAVAPKFHLSGKEDANKFRYMPAPTPL